MKRRTRLRRILVAANVQAGWFAHYVGKVTIEPGEKISGELLKL